MCSSDLSEAAAVEKAFEIINFRTQLGSSRLTQLAHNVVFMNAFFAASRAALKVAASEGISPRERSAALKTLASNAAWVSGLSILYSLANSGDEDYERLTPQERASKFVIPGMGGWGIPIRLSIATLPKTLAEAFIHQMSDHADDPAKFRTVLGDIMVASTISGTMPLPQPVMLGIEAATNHSFFTGKPIVGRNLEDREAFMQYGSGTSELSKAIGSGWKTLANSAGIESEGLSPQRIDHMIRGTLGMYGAAAMLLTNAIATKVGGRPESSMNDIIASLPGMSTVGVKDFDDSMKDDLYDLIGRINKAVKTANELKSLGKPDEFQKYVEDNRELLKYKGMAARVQDQLAKIRKNIARVTASDMEPSEKAIEIRRLKTVEKEYIHSLDVHEKRMSAGLGFL